MATAKREIRSAMPSVDLVIEVLDARIPFSSENPLVAELRGNKPCIQILNKSDLADPDITARWLAFRGQTPNLRLFTHSIKHAGLRTVLMRTARELATVRDRPMVAMTLGIPNVGKSTLINTLAGRTIAKTADKPAITQHQQRVLVGTDLVLLDTPGFLWPRLSPEACGYRLAITGAISERAFDFGDIANFAAAFLTRHYPGPVAACYGLSALPEDPTALVEAVGRRRGFLGKGGVVDLQRAAERLIHDLRDGKFGGVSLETPTSEPSSASASDV